MMRTAAAIAKTILVVVVVGAVLVASFYSAYILTAVVVLGGVGLIAYLFFSRDPDKNIDWFDFKD